MKLTKSQLKQIIKEELEKVLSTEAARKIGPKKSMERPMKHRARYYKYEDGTFKSSDGSIRPEDYKPIDERDMEEIVLDHLESLLIRDKRGGVHGPEKPSHGQLEFIMHLWKTGSDKLKDYDGNPVTDLFQMEDEDLLKLLDQIPGEGDRPGYGAAATGKRLKHRAPIEPTSSPGTWAENKTRLTKQQLKQFIKEELLQLELFDTGSAGDEVGGTSLEQKKKLCAERGGEWISDDPSGEYGHCSKAAKEELEEELQEEGVEENIGFNLAKYGSDQQEAFGYLMRLGDRLGSLKQTISYLEQKKTDKDTTIQNYIKGLKAASEVLSHIPVSLYNMEE